MILYILYIFSMFVLAFFHVPFIKNKFVSTKCANGNSCIACCNCNQQLVMMMKIKKTKALFILNVSIIWWPDLSQNPLNRIMKTITTRKKAAMKQNDLQRSSQSCNRLLQHAFSSRQPPSRASLWKQTRWRKCLLHKWERVDRLRPYSRNGQQAKPWTWMMLMILIIIIIIKKAPLL